MPTILCIDDNATGLATRKTFLELMGYSVLVAEDGITGLAKLFESMGGGSCGVVRGRIDAVILDYRMPGMDGAAVASLIRNEQPDLPIILLTGFAQELPESLLDSVDAVITKGERPQTLLATLERVTGIKPKKPPAKVSQAVEEARKIREQARALRSERRSLTGRRFQSDRRRCTDLESLADNPPEETD
jgi:CheY-like chemotaxis protein